MEDLEKQLLDKEAKSMDEWIKFSEYMGDSVDSKCLFHIVFDECSDINAVGANVETVEFTDYTKFSNENDGFYNIGLFINDNAVDSGIRIRKGDALSSDDLHIGLINLYQKVYDSCKKLAPNVLIVSADILPTILLDDKFNITTSIGNKSIYKCGTYEDKSVYVSAGLDEGVIVGMVVCPMMSAIGISNADGCFSFKVLNKNLMQKMKVID